MLQCHVDVLFYIAIKVLVICCNLIGCHWHLVCSKGAPMLSDRYSDSCLCFLRWVCMCISWVVQLWSMYVVCCTFIAQYLLKHAMLSLCTEVTDYYIDFSLWGYAGHGDCMFTYRYIYEHMHNYMYVANSSHALNMADANE